MDSKLETMKKDIAAIDDSQKTALATVTKSIQEAKTDCTEARAHHQQNVYDGTLNRSLGQLDACVANGFEAYARALKQSLCNAVTRIEDWNETMKSNVEAIEKLMLTTRELKKDQEVVNEKLERDLTSLRDEVTHLRNESDEVNAKLLGALTGNKTIIGAGDTACWDVSSLDASVTDLAIELRAKITKLEEQIKANQRSKYSAKDKIDAQYPWLTSSMESDALGEVDEQGAVSVNHDISFLRRRIKLLENDCETAIDNIEYTDDTIKRLRRDQNKDRNNMNRKSNAVSTRIDNAYSEIEWLTSKLVKEDEAGTVADLEERVDSLTEEVTTLRTAQQDHRRAIYDWSADIDKNKRGLEEQVKEADKRVEALEIATGWGWRTKITGETVYIMPDTFVNGSPPREPSIEEELRLFGDTLDTRGNVRRGYGRMLPEREGLDRGLRVAMPHR